MMGTINYFLDVWFQENLVAKILLISKVKGNYLIRYNRVNGNQLTVHNIYRKALFKEILKGPCCHSNNNKAFDLLRNTANTGYNP